MPSTYVLGFRPPDEKWKRMKEAREACEAAGIDIPEDIDDFFGGEKPDEKGVEVQLDNGHPCCKDWDDGYMRSGFEVEISKLPKDIKILRFYNSW
jgi:hypothetical protein